MFYLTIISFSLFLDIDSSTLFSEIDLILQFYLSNFST